MSAHGPYCGCLSCRRIEVLVDAGVCERRLLADDTWAVCRTVDDAEAHRLMIAHLAAGAVWPAS